MRKLWHRLFGHVWHGAKPPAGKIPPAPKYWSWAQCSCGEGHFYTSVAHVIPDIWKDAPIVTRQKPYRRDQQDNG